MSEMKKIIWQVLEECLVRHFIIFREQYQLKCTDIDINEPWLEFLDFTDRDAYIEDVNEFKPDYLFHLGAFTDLEYCESIRMKHILRIHYQLKTQFLLLMD